MGFFKRLLLLISFILLVSCQNLADRHIASEHHISSSSQQLVDWETKANNIAVRSNEVFRVEHYEIPLKYLQSDFDESLDPDVKKSLIFTKNGEQYVRWPINPEDTTWHLEIKKFLEDHSVESEPKKFFDGYLTASRSMIMVNPTNGATFSLKVSTDKTGGKWSSKKLIWADAQQVRRISKYVKGTVPQMQTEHLVIMDEPLALGLTDKNIDQALLVRSLNDLPEDGHYYIPGFAIFHEKEGPRIAKLNGSTNPVEFWTKHLVDPLANAMAEYFAVTGSWYDSPHAQNFLVELDREMKPTGKIVLRDLGDAYLFEDFVKNTKYAWIMKDWEEGNVLTKSFTTGIGLLHGNEKPTWVSGMEYKEMQWQFYRTFEKKFSELTNIPANELMKTDSKEAIYSFSRKTYPTTSAAWQKFAAFANCMNGEAKSLSGEKCPEYIIKRQVKIDCVRSATSIINH